MYLHKYCISTLRCLLRPASIQAGLLRVNFCEDGKCVAKHEMATQETDLGLTKKPFFAAELRNAEADEFMRTLSDEMKEEKVRAKAVMGQLQAENERVPQTISNADWKIILTEIRGFHSLRKYCRYLFKKEVSMENSKLRKEQKQREKLAQPENFLTENLFSIHVHNRKKWDLKWRRNRVQVFGHPVIVDLDYRQSVREERLLLQQLFMFAGWNVQQEEPLCLHLTSVHSNSIISSLCNSKEGESMPFRFHNEHFTEIFPKEDLVYLSPEGAGWGGEFNRDKIYVMGGLVDKFPARPRESFGKAKELGIECRSFPLSRCVKHKEGSRSGTVLTCDIPFKVVHNMMLHENWERALLDHLPPSCFAPVSEQLASVENSYNQKQYKKFQNILSAYKT